MSHQLIEIQFFINCCSEINTGNKACMRLDKMIKELTVEKVGLGLCLPLLQFLLYVSSFQFSYSFGAFGYTLMVALWSAKSLFIHSKKTSYRAKALQILKVYDCVSSVFQVSIRQDLFILHSA